MKYRKPTDYGEPINSLIDAALRTLQHDSGEVDKEWHWARERLAEDFRKILCRKTRGQVNRTTRFKDTHTTRRPEDRGRNEKTIELRSPRQALSAVELESWNEFLQGLMEKSPCGECVCT